MKQAEMDDWRLGGTFTALLIGTLLERWCGGCETLDELAVGGLFLAVLKSAFLKS